MKKFICMISVLFGGIIFCTSCMMPTNKDNITEKNLNDVQVDEFHFIANGDFPSNLEFANKEEMLLYFGFYGEDAYYQYYDESQKIKLEFFWKEEENIGCGIGYKYYNTPENEEKVWAGAFAFDNYDIETWNRDTYSLLSYEGDTGEGSVTDYEESIEYTDDGKLRTFISKGVIDWLDEQPTQYNILEIKFNYREDGSLYHKSYAHNPLIFGTSLCSLDSYYDEKERLIYENGYITHGSVEYYYIYLDEDEQPKYCICLDWMSAECWPAFIRYQ